MTIVDLEFWMTISKSCREISRILITDQKSFYNLKIKKYFLKQIQYIYIIQESKKKKKQTRHH